MKEFKLSKDQFFSTVYPIIMSALILLGYFAKIEAYTATLNILITSFILLTNKSLKPLMFFVLTFFYQMTVENSPMDPIKSDNYFTGIRPYLLIGSAVIFVVSVFVYVFKNKLLSKVKFTKIPLIIPMLVLCIGLLSNGLFKSDYTFGNFLWGFALVVVYFLLFLLLYLGLAYEDANDMVEYFTYINLVISWILLIQVAGIYLTGDLFAESGVIRGAFSLGFGKTNAVGFVLATFIPMNFYGFMKTRNGFRALFHLFTAFALFGAALTSTSRNAVLIGGIYFAFCFIFMMFAGDRKKLARILVPISVVAVALAVALFFKDEFLALIKHYVERTKLDEFTQSDLNSSSAGRINIWKTCFEIFTQYPLFGAGFFGEEMKFATPMAAVIPHFAHNTLFQLLAGTGAFGTLCYGYYRICTLKYLFRKPTLDRFMLIVSASMLLTGSLLDNHLFNIYPGLLYTVQLVIAVLLYEKQFNEQKPQFIEEIEEMLDQSKETANV